ncbi:ATP-binding protein [Candidatus Woesearchaeota archaeon]|nr:ATP-binding protein [Candidatus Woesearchaeota archaeon]
MADIMDALRRLRKLSPEEEESLRTVEWYTGPKQLRIIRGLLKERKLSITSESASMGGLIDKVSYPRLVAEHDSPAVAEVVTRTNSTIDSKTDETMVRSFACSVHDKLHQIVAPGIVGFETIKKAVALQLFSPEHIHILLLGDPGTGKTVVLNSATELAPVSAMGLGSGTSGVGLAVTVKGKEVIKGLLPMADKGLCAIDELNLMKEESRASLYNAMEKGFVSYDKGGHSFRFDARVSVLATANPKGDKFTGRTTEELKKQLPFDAALLSRFHLTFLVRKHDLDEFKRITRSLLNTKKASLSKKELKFLTGYITRAHALGDIRIPRRFEQDIVDFIGEIKANESRYLVEVSPRMVVGFSRLAKASARMELRDQVEQKDVDLVKSIVQESLKVA